MSLNLLLEIQAVWGVLFEDQAVWGVLLENQAVWGAKLDIAGFSYLHLNYRYEGQSGIQVHVAQAEFGRVWRRFARSPFEWQFWGLTTNIGKCEL